MQQTECSPKQCKQPHYTSYLHRRLLEKPYTDLLICKQTDSLPYNDFDLTLSGNY